MYDYWDLIKKYKDLQQENKQLKEQLENKIDLYEDTISYQLGFDKGKEYLQQKIDKAIEYIKEKYWDNLDDDEGTAFCDKLLEILGDKENE
jgi:regulator of replication initiation timing